MESTELWQQVRKQVEFFHQEKYWECHEALEDVWMELPHGEERNLVWAIIQVSVSLYHWREKNLAGAKGMLEKARDKARKVSLQTRQEAQKFLEVESFFAMIMEDSPYEKLKHYRFYS